MKLEIGALPSVERTIGRQPKSAVVVALTDTDRDGFSDGAVVGTQS